MIKLLVFGFILVCAGYAWFPDYTWAITPVFAVIAVLWLVIKIVRSLSGSKQENSQSIEDKWDEYDWWQDNQGL